MIKKNDKRGQGLSTNAIILIVLGVLVLAILVAGFAIGWDKVAPWLSSENVDSVVASCETACTTQSIFGYCSKPRTLNDGDKEFEKTCAVFADPANKEEYGAYGVGICPGLCPDETPEEQEETPEAPAEETP